MPYDEGHAQIMRDTLEGLDALNLDEKKMFGGLCFMMRGHMLCGVHNDGGMARVGKEREEEAKQFEHVGPLQFTGRKMGGLVELDPNIFDEENLEQILKLALAFNLEQKPK